MKKITIIVISLLCCAFLLGSCNTEDDNPPPPADHNEDDKNDKGDDPPDPKPENPAKLDDKIKTSQPASGKATPEENTTSADTPEEGNNDSSLEDEDELSPMTDDEGYYTILNASNDSELIISFFSSGNSRSKYFIVLQEDNCVKVTEAQFLNDIFEITLIDNDDFEEELFCGDECLFDDCMSECVANNYEVDDGWVYDSVELSDGPSTSETCVPLLEFESADSQ